MRQSMTTTTQDPKGPPKGTYRVLHGGGGAGVRVLIAPFRDNSTGDDQSPRTGFRIACPKV